MPNHLGQVGGQTHRVAASAITVQAAGYVLNDVIGGKIPLANLMRPVAKTGMLQNMLLAIKGTFTTALDVVLFDADPATSTLTDKSALVISDADVAKVITVVSLDLIKTKGGFTFYEATGLTRFMELPSDGIWCAIVAGGAITFAATGDVRALTATMAQD